MFIYLFPCNQVPFEVLVRRQISRLLDPSLQCARFIYDELMKVGTKLQGLPSPLYCFIKYVPKQNCFSSDQPSLYGD